GNPVPWIAYPAIALLDERLARGMSLLEFGAGYSTLFFMQRVARVVSIEHDLEWLGRVRARVDANVELVAAPRDPAADYANALGARPDRFDVVLVDGIHRNEAFEAGLARLGPSGVILLDDSQRDRYAPAFAAARAAGFRHLHLEGPKPMSVDL